MYTKISMKSAARIFLIIITTLLATVGIVLATIRFQFLEPTFWENSFDKHNVYNDLSAVVKKTVEAQITHDGGRVSDAKVLTDIITPGNLRDFITKNLVNVLGYVDGLYPKLNFYIPVSKIPKGLLPKNIAYQSEEVPVSTLLTEFNVNFISASQIQSFSLFGKVLTYLVILIFALVGLFLLLLFILVDAGKRFTAPAAAFLITGILMLGLCQAGSQAVSALSLNLLQKTVTAEVIVGTIIPPLIQDIVRIWLFIGIILAAVGIILFFLKKPLYNKL